jgi:hypothetical protein
MLDVNAKFIKLHSKQAQRKITKGEYVKPSKKILVLMNDDQVGRCAICESEFNRTDNKYHTDHCHKTKKVRGLLCGPCNVGLGMFKDNLHSLERAIKYLKGDIKFRY